MAQSLQTLLEGLYAAVLDARRLVDAQHLKQFESYFDTQMVPDPKTGAPVQAFVPRLIPIATARAAGPQDVFDLTNVPALALTKLGYLSLDSIEIEFEAKLTNLDQVDARAPPSQESLNQAKAEPGILRRTFGELFGTTAEPRIMPKSGTFESGAAPAKVRISFKTTDTVEGMHLIQERMFDHIRQ